MCFDEKRKLMVDTQIKARGITSEKILDAMAAVKREKFVPKDKIDSACGDYPLPIGHNQTISQPYIVALMSDLAMLRGKEKVLEIGTGSGYQTAILSLLSYQVYSIERIRILAEKSQKLLLDEGFSNCTVIYGDGYRGYPEEAPYDAIIVTAAPPQIPSALKEQLSEGGRLILPVGDYYQKLMRITRRGRSYENEDIIPVAFVPMLPDTC